MFQAFKNHMRPYFDEARRMSADRQPKNEDRPAFYDFEAWCKDRGYGMGDPDVPITEQDARREYEHWKIDHCVDFRTGRPQC